MNLSVIIPCFNAAKTLATQLEALTHQKWDQLWELILVDNGSTDSTLAIAKQYQDKFSYFRIVQAFDGKGAAYARNYGARLAMGRNLAFCDADDEVAPGWVAAIGNALSQFDLVGGCCEIKKLNPDWAIKARFREIDRKVWSNELLKFDLSPDYPYYTPSCNLGIQRIVHEKLGGFDETLLIGEDIEYCRQAQVSGFVLHYVPDALVYYRLRNSLVGLYQQSYAYSKYRVLLHQKYQSTRSLEKDIMAWRLLLQALLQARSKTDLALWLYDLAWRRGYEAGKKKYGSTG